MDAEPYQPSRFTGFLSSEEPLQRLPKHFAAWEETLDRLTELIEAGQLREEVGRWPQVHPSSDALPTERHWQRACLVLTLIAQGYVWMRGVEGTVGRLPAVLAKPWWEVSDHLGIPPVGTYASVVLYNWRLADPSCGVSPENLRTLHTYTGTRDEEWFYLVSMFCELAAAPGISAAIEAWSAIEESNSIHLVACLSRVASSLVEIRKSLDRMYEECKPDVFYHKIRPFQSGYTDTDTFPNGLIYDGLSEDPQRFGGASAAQSSLIPVFDILLGVEKTGEGGNFLRQQRWHMPRPHREFLMTLAKRPSLRSYVEQCKETELTSSYNECIKELAEFRSHHVILVTRMIVNPASSSITNMAALATTGTGGTNFMIMLKKLRDETLSYQLKE